MKEKQSISQLGCSSPSIVKVFGLPVICACGQCYWCREHSRSAFRELTFKRQVIVTDNGTPFDDDAPI